MGEEEVNTKADAAILDCPLSDMRNGLVNMNVNSSEMKACDKFIQFFFGFSLDDADGTIQIAKSTLPVLVFEGGQDKMIPSFIVESLYKAVSHDRKQLKIFKDSGHCSACNKHPKDYMRTVENFLKQ